MRKIDPQVRKGHVDWDKRWRRLRFPNKKGSCNIGYPLRLKAGELVTTTELIRFQETKSIFILQWKLFFFLLFLQLVINKNIFHRNWEIGLSRTSGIYFRTLKVLSNYFAMLENLLKVKNCFYLYSWVTWLASVNNVSVLFEMFRSATVFHHFFLSCFLARSIIKLIRKRK